MTFRSLGEISAAMMFKLERERELRKYLADNGEQAREGEAVDDAARRVRHKLLGEIAAAVSRIG